MVVGNGCGISVFCGYGRESLSFDPGEAVKLVYATRHARRAPHFFPFGCNSPGEV